MLTKKPYYTLNDKELEYWKSKGLLDNRSEFEIVKMELNRAIYKSVEPLFIAILEFLSNAIIKITCFIGRSRK